MQYLILLAFIITVPILDFAAETKEVKSRGRIAYYVASSHWDREWYEPLQGFRMRLVSMLDEVFRTFNADPDFKAFFLDGQVIPIEDYLEIRAAKRELVDRFVREGRLRMGPWYVLPDEWLISSESFVRNLQMGQKIAREFGAPASKAGFVCDMFGHVGQLPQIFDQMNLPVAFLWRGTLEKEHKGHFNWEAPDGTVIPAYRFGKSGYCTYAWEVRGVAPWSYRKDQPFDLDIAVDRLVDYVHKEAERSSVSPILLFDGADHTEIEPQTSALINRANKKLESEGIRIIHSDLDNYIDDLLNERSKITKSLIGELRETARDPGYMDNQNLFPGILSSRIHLKQQNAICEDELCLWAEPFNAFISTLGYEYPEDFLRVAWKYLLENHAHDSMGGCSIDQVHKDMLFRFDQSLGISTRLTSAALKEIALAAAPTDMPDDAILMTVFNATSEDIKEPVDIEIPLPVDWPKRFGEFFGYEQKFSFKLSNAKGEEVTYQLVRQQRDRKEFMRDRYKMPKENRKHIITVCAPLNVPAFGYTTLLIKPVHGPTRYLGSMTTSHCSIENETLIVQAESNGTISIADKRTAKRYKQILTFENCADIGDGWFHGIAVNDRTYLSTACAADVALISNGIAKATLRMTTIMNVPKQFDFKNMERSTETAPLKIVSDITLRKGSDRVEVETTVDNTILDHRLRVLLPTNVNGETYLSDSAFDVVERKIALAEDNDVRRELDVDTRPQITWTAFSDGKTGLAVVSRGLPECAVIDRDDHPIALTLFRAFRRAVFSNDNTGGQIQGKLTFRYDIVPIVKGIPIKKLFILGQRVNGMTRTITLLPNDVSNHKKTANLPTDYNFLRVKGNVVVTSIQSKDEKMLIRLFNPYDTDEKIVIKPAYAFNKANCVTLDGRVDQIATIRSNEESIQELIPKKRISTVVIE